MYTNIEYIEKNVKTQPQCLMATIMFQDPYLPWSRVTPQPRPPVSEIWIQAGVSPSARHQDQPPGSGAHGDGENSDNTQSQSELQYK